MKPRTRGSCNRETRGGRRHRRYRRAFSGTSPDGGNRTSRRRPTRSKGHRKPWKMIGFVVGAEKESAEKKEQI